jgi:hypothetical protein
MEYNIVVVPVWTQAVEKKKGETRSMARRTIEASAHRRLNFGKKEGESLDLIWKGCWEEEPGIFFSYSWARVCKEEEWYVVPFK